MRSDIEKEKMELLFVIKIFQQLDDVHISVWSKRMDVIIKGKCLSRCLLFELNETGRKRAIDSFFQVFLLNLLLNINPTIQWNSIFHVGSLNLGYEKFYLCLTLCGSRCGENGFPRKNH